MEYFNKNIELVGEEDLPLDVYMLRLSHSVLRLLEDIEDTGINQESEDYKSIRHRILDICGALQRLPNNLTCHEEEKAL